jgi:hypothetical protein
LDNEKLDPCFVALQKKNIEIVLERGRNITSTRNEEVGSIVLSFIMKTMLRKTKRRSFKYVTKSQKKNTLGKKTLLL